MKKILIIGLLLILPSCALLDKARQFEDNVSNTIQKVVTPDNFDTITLAYASVSATGDGFYSLCERKLIKKSCWKIIEYLQPYESKAYKAYMALGEFVKRNPNNDPTSLILLARSAINSLKNVQLQYGVK